MYLKRSFGEYLPEQWHSVPTKPVPVYVQAIEGFARAVRQGQCLPIDAKAARQVLKIVLAIYRSAAEQRTITIS
jgi:predicted dehydrogenase